MIKHHQTVQNLSVYYVKEDEVDIKDVMEPQKVAETVDMVKEEEVVVKA